MYKNLKKEQRRWGVIKRVLEKTGATVQARGIIYKAMSQSVLLYGRKSWVVTEAMLKVLEGFNHRAARHITGMTSICGANAEWEYPPVVAAMESALLHPVMKYIRSRHATIVEKVACRPVYELCIEEEGRPGTSRRMIWCYRDVVNEPEE